MSATHFDWLNGDIRTLREDYARVRAKPVPPDATWHRIGADPDAVNVLRFPGDGQAKTAIVYFHGGGFIVGSPVTHADIAVRLAHHTKLPVYSVDYRLAPDHIAPAPAADGITVIRYLIESGVRHLAICGDSAGGAIALATEASLPDDLHKHVTAVASFYGAHGLLDTGSIRARGNRADGTDRDCVKRYFDLAGREAYSIETLAGASTSAITNEKEPLPNPSPQGGGASALHRRAKQRHLSIGDEAAGLAPPPCGEGLGRGLSSDPMMEKWLADQKGSNTGQHGPEPSRVPIYLLAAEDDALRDDMLILADALTATGRAVTLDRVPDVDHGFLHGGESNAAAEAALARFATWLAAQ